MKIFLKSLLLILLSITILNYNIQADEIEYLIYNEGEIVSSFSDYISANYFYLNNVDNYDNLVLQTKEEVFQMEYGILIFDTDHDIEYYSLSNDRIDYFNANYAIDALYLYSKDDLVYYVLNNEICYTEKENVELVPYYYNIEISSYQVKNGELVHNIRTTNKHQYYSISNVINKAPNYLNENTIYYSYDGLYFYDDFYQMVDDYRQDNRLNAINDERYFNYYQYLSFKSKSSYTSNDINKYLENKLGFIDRIYNFVDDNKDDTNDYLQYSQIYQSGNYFIADQEVYQDNALMLLSSALNESNLGKSRNSFVNNNLYSMASYNSNIQRESSRYKNIATCIHNFANLTINTYFGHFRKDFYTGSYYGDKASGLSSVYSLDPYYGENCASYYYQIDSYFDNQDLDRYFIAYTNKPITLYEDKDLDNSIYTLTNNEIYFTILNEYEDSYSILLENNTVVYIDKSDVEVLNQATSNHESIPVSIDFNGGNYNGVLSTTLNVEDINNINDIHPCFEGYDFVDYELVDGVYIANYKEIESVIKYCNFENELVKNKTFNLQDQNLLVTYKDRSSKLVPITSDIISYYFDDEAYVLLEYNGFILKHEFKTIDENNDQELFDEYYQSQRYNELKRLYLKSNIDLDFDELRTIDKIFKERNKRNYIMSDSLKEDIMISGLDLALPDKKTFSLFEDSYYINVSNVSDSEIKKVKSVFNEYGFDVVNAINIGFKFNYEDIDLTNKAIVSIQINDKKDNCIYSVYELTKNGLKKCKTQFSDQYVSFEIKNSGNYVILCKDSFNQYHFNDPIENISRQDTGIDNNKINIEFLITIVLFITNFIGVIVYYLLSDRKDRLWKDFKKSLQMQDTVLEEKQKN